MAAKGELPLSEIYIVIIALIFALNLGLLSWALVDLLKRENVKYLSKAGWIVIIAVIIFGSVIYLLVGRGEEK
jgi:type VI protein secretion system component VasK